MPIRIPWDDYEIALMFEVYKKMEAGMTLSAAAQELSGQLRQKAKNQGIELDDVFRNKNGMIFYLKRTEYLFTNGKSGLDGAQKNVVQMFQVYQNNPFQYQEILLEAQRLAGIADNHELHEERADFSQYLSEESLQSINQEKGEHMEDKEKELKDRFAEWISGKISRAQFSELYQDFLQLDEFCLTRHILQNPIFQTDDVLTLRKALISLENNKIFRIKYHSENMLSFLKYYIRFIKENRNDFQKVTQSSEVAAVKISQDNSSDQRSIENTQSVEVAINESEDAILHKFKQWLKENNSLSSRSIYQYWHAIKNTGDYIQEQRLHFPLFKGSPAEIQMTACVCQSKSVAKGRQKSQHLSTWEW